MPKPSTARTKQHNGHAAVEFAPMKRSNYFLPEHIKAGLRKLADIRDVSEAELVRQAVETLLKRNKITTEH